MKQKSIFRALMALVALGVVFVSCTNADNPYNTTAPDGEYVLVKDSASSSTGDSQISVWEYDAEGRVVKETIDFYYSDGTSDHDVNTFTYSQNLITRETVRNGVETYSAYFYLNSKGLVESVKDELWDKDCGFEYDDDDRIMVCSESDHRDSVVWKNGDVEKYIAFGADDKAICFTPSRYEVNFPYVMPYLVYTDTSLTQIGVFGKTTRHLISNMHHESEKDGNTAYFNHDYSYVVQNGLVMEFTDDVNEWYSENGETKDFSRIEHHIFTWKKIK